MHKSVIAGICLAIGLSACTAVPPVSGASPAASTAPKATGLITGTVLLPSRFNSGVIPTGGGNVLPTGSGNVIPTGGGNLAPLAGAKVFLADAAGQPYPSLSAVTTDSQGSFSISSVPSGYTFMVVAQARDTQLAKDVTLQTLVRSSDLGATAPITVGTSLVTIAVTEGQGGTLGDFNAATFRTASEATAKNLKDNDIPDLSDRSAMVRKVDELATSVAELKQAVNEIRQTLKDIKKSIDDLTTKVNNQVTLAPGLNPGSQPPPMGQNPFGCEPPKLVSLALKGTYSGYPLRLDFVNQVGHVTSQVYFATAGSVAQGMVPTTCPHVLNLRDSKGTILASAQSFAVPPTATGTLDLPF